MTKRVEQKTGVLTKLQYSFGVGYITAFDALSRCHFVKKLSFLFRSYSNPESHTIYLEEKVPPSDTRAMLQTVCRALPSNAPLPRIYDVGMLVDTPHLQVTYIPEYFSPLPR